MERRKKSGGGKCYGRPRMNARNQKADFSRSFSDKKRNRRNRV